MDSGYYAAMTGLVARTQALDTAAANLANAQTPGYRAEREYFRSVLLGPDAPRLATGADGEQLRPAGRRPARTWPRAHCSRPAIRWIWRLKGRDSLQVQTAQRPALYARRQLSSLAERAAGDRGGRAGAFLDRPADSGSAGRGLGGRRRRAFGGRRRGGHGGRLHISRRRAAHAGGRQSLRRAGGRHADVCEGRDGPPGRHRSRPTRM